MAPVCYQQQDKEVHSDKIRANGHGVPSDVLLSKKMQFLEANSQQNGIGDRSKVQPQEGDVFHDTQTLGVHVGNKRISPDEEPIVIFDTQNNTSIAQTAKDQFAAALLRLQSGLDVSKQRLDSIEAKVETLTRQQRQQSKQSSSSNNKATTWRGALLGNGRVGTLLYLSWPILVFVAMRALERRSMMKKLA